MKAKPADKQTLDAAIRDAIAKNGGKRISRPEFLAASGLRFRDIFLNYSGWEEALRGAGFKFQPYHTPLGPGALLAEWGDVVRKLRRLPTQHEYRLHGPRNANSVVLQFGSWLRVPGAFRRFARNRKEWADVIALINSHPQKARPARPRFIRKPRTFKLRPRRGHRMRSRPEYGDQLDIPALRHAPSNEQGVIYLFGIMAERLGFAVERLQIAFPDCLAKRRIGRSGKWQNVAIEFEYESRDFRDHRHDPDGCDIIICWVHNWTECPKNIEVIALNEELDSWRGSGARAAIKRLKDGRLVPA